MNTLQQEKRWCLWRRETRKDGTPSKVPYNADGNRAKSDDPRTWIDFQLAQMMDDGEQYNGIGVFFGRVPGVDGSINLCGIDIDGDHNGDSGAHNGLEAEVLQLFKDTYAEKSPSGTGAHVLFTVDPARVPHVTVTAKDGTTSIKLDPRYYLKNPSNGLEFYAGGWTNRFFTFTGDRVSAGDAITDQTDALLTFLDRFMRRPERAARTTHTRVQTSTPTTDGNPVNVEKRLNVARNAKNGDDFRKLYDLGDTSKYNGDDSAADAGLCAMLAFYLDGDPALIDDAFRNSALYRSKWDERHGAQTYGEMTIAKAVDTLTDVYHEPRFKYRPTNSADLTDAGNAEVFTAMYGDVLRWCDALGWLVWDGRVWNPDDHAAESLALEFSNAMLLEAFTAMQSSTLTDGEGKTVTDPGAKAYLQHARKTRAATGIRNMLTLAKAWLAIPANDLDADPYTLNTNAGLIDLHTGVCRPHDPTAYCTQLVPFTPSTDGAEMWQQFLDLVTCNDGDVKAYLQRVAGMSIVGAVKSEGIQIAYGGGRNGKSTYFNALQNVLAGYAGSMDADTLTTERTNKAVNLATLRGKRLVVCGELEEGQRLSIKELKRVAATDQLVIKQLYKNPETIRPTHHIVMYTNVLPRVGSTDTGTWRRLTVIPFKATMPTGDAEIKDYAEVLSSTAGGAILQWMIDGAREYLANGCKLKPPAAVKATTNEYRQREDWLQRFVNECCTRDPHARTLASDLYMAYKAYTGENGAFTLKSVDFTEGMKRLGFNSVAPQRRVEWLGIRLNYSAAANDFDDLTAAR